MVQAMILFLLGVGVCLLIAGVAAGGLSEVPSPVWEALWGGLALACLCRSVRRALRRWRAELRLRRGQRQESALAARLTPQLFGDYPPYVIEAAERLGQERDRSAVPALLRALEQSVDTQRPGWQEQAESLANALAQMGDRRALPLLYRLESVRGIGFIPAIRGAITSIEPQTSLLRPGSADFTVPETLLRPARSIHADEPPAVLLRAVDRASGD